jgi:hypothetical protein
MRCCPQVVNLLLANVWLLQSVLEFLSSLCSSTNSSRDIHQLTHKSLYMASAEVGAYSAEVGVDALGNFLWAYWVLFLHGDPAKLAAHAFQSSLHGDYMQSQQTLRGVRRWLCLMSNEVERQMGHFAKLFSEKGHLQCCPRLGQRPSDPPHRWAAASET